MESKGISGGHPHAHVIRIGGDALTLPEPSGSLPSMALNKKHVLGCLAVVLLLLIVAAVLIAVYHPEWLKPPAPKQPTTSTTAPSSSTGPGRPLVLMTWNVRGYPEKDAATRTWFSKQLADLAPDVLCIQEISGQSKITTFMSAESRFTKYAFSDSSDGQDNAIFVDSAADIRQLPTPAGFQHPATAAYVTSDGFDAVVVTVHLSWTDVSKRAHEKQLLRGVVADALKIDPDVIVTGDFNTQRPDIDELAAEAFRGRATHFSEMGGSGINPTELVATLINRESSFSAGIEYAQQVIKGSCSVLVLTEDSIYAARDRLGRTPVVIGCKPGA
jgi:endonuclease/exonuclease/phosphatase family metal-dependent hydrolase